MSIWCLTDGAGECVLGLEGPGSDGEFSDQDEEVMDEDDGEGPLSEKEFLDAQLLVLHQRDKLLPIISTQSSLSRIASPMPPLTQTKTPSQTST